MPAENIVLTATANANEVGYTVQEYEMTLSGSYANKTSIPNTTAKTGSTVTYTINAAEGFTFDKVKTLEANGSTISIDAENTTITATVTVDASGNANLVIKVYYKRNQFTLTYNQHLLKTPLIIKSMDKDTTFSLKNKNYVIIK